ncbi:hypothetical protein MtrunA17_Chr1g0152101 [Medicago truncatula]|uniref:Uncharacterized protein n=1 Tax=Medicago truncatula TaxID=3880 RepID=A0A072VEX1_MEDTR|nr:hypothetical protein MTR_1g017300 [Medicago truncatula]RHN77193.1 hypothetical protein MtrunA17_Chr1g0152101 [Medicago truncatula]
MRRADWLSLHGIEQKDFEVIEKISEPLQFADCGCHDTDLSEVCLIPKAIWCPSVFVWRLIWKQVVLCQFETWKSPIQRNISIIPGLQS